MRISTKLLSVLPLASLFATDLRISSNAVVPVQVKISGTWTMELPGPGGRVGNWRSDPSSPGGVIALDAPFAHARVPNDMFLMPVPTGAPPYTAQHLTSVSNSWNKGNPLVVLPASGKYIGNPWFCLTSDSHPENEYMLFQAQDNASVISSNANPGIGIDNQVWIYGPVGQKASQLTFYMELSTSTVNGGGVLDPQCSEDSDSSNGVLHIVYAHIIQAIPGSFGNTGGPSSTTTAWFGDWELVYADVNFDVSGNLICTGTGETPCFTNMVTVNPRDAANPSSVINGSDGSYSATACGGSGYLTAMHEDLSGVTPGAGVRFGTAFPYDYSIVSSSGSNYLCLEDPITPSKAANFSVHSLTYIEPHRYLSNLGDLYYSTNSLYILHDSAGALFNDSGSPMLQILNQTYPPGTSPVPGFNANVAKTWFNEFFTPFPPSVTVSTPKPIGRSIFMSDRAATSKWSLVPEYSDHYMCGPPNCQLPIRMTEYNNPDGSPGADSTCSTCAPTVATRGAWSPSGAQYLTMNQYIPTMPPAYAELHLYNLQFPRTELGGTAVLSGTAILQ